MNYTNHNQIHNYKFEDHYSNIKLVFIGNFTLASFYSFLGIENFMINPFAIASTLSAIIIFIFYFLYDWKNRLINFLILIFYIGLYIVEITVYGIPTTPIESDGMYTKRSILQLILTGIPIIYTGVRIVIVVPLIQIFFSSKQLRCTSKNNLYQ